MMTIDEILDILPTGVYKVTFGYETEIMSLSTNSLHSLELVDIATDEHTNTSKVPIDIKAKGNYFPKWRYSEISKIEDLYGEIIWKKPRYSPVCIRDLSIGDVFAVGSIHGTKMIKINNDDVFQETSDNPVNCINIANKHHMSMVTDIPIAYFIENKDVNDYV